MKIIQLLPCFTLLGAPRQTHYRIPVIQSQVDPLKMVQKKRNAAFSLKMVIIDHLLWFAVYFFFQYIQSWSGSWPRTSKILAWSWSWSSLGLCWCWCRLDYSTRLRWARPIWDGLNRSVKTLCHHRDSRRPSPTHTLPLCTFPARLR